MSTSPQPQTTPPAALFDKINKAYWNDPSVASTYTRAENATVPFARHLVQKSGLPNTLTSPISVFDLACGNGALASALYSSIPPSKWPLVTLLGGDKSEPMVSYMVSRAKSQGWTGLTGKVVDGTDMHDIPKHEFTHVFVNFGIFMMPPATLGTCHDLLVRDKGFVGISTWSYLPWMRFVKKAISRMSAPQPYCPSGEEVAAKVYNNIPWSSPSFLTSTLKEHGFVDVEAETVRATAECGTPAEFCETMQMPLQLVAGFWGGEGEEKKILLDGLSKMFREVVVEEVGGEEGSLSMEFEAVLTTGWTKAQ
ncbi:hypothetical protein BCR34DRAFT_590464 [Clohesyomyces aquaticus]|uniref:S-adenosyl-L-methionine-dependent methyltransferase n=1 Tax=Clohesyomyces aquaticus TaxID=1231657 RepID=A0A1Y1Z9G2_9PLEO|nr:hypothetical protein BCR34DRAFT_590464 [Clohesyomyces aquaticus]